VSTLAIVALVLALVLVGLTLLPVRLRFSLQARGEPNGFWALAGGAQVGPVAASGIAAKGVPAHINVHAFGKKLWHKQLAELLQDKPGDQAPEEAEEAPPARVSESYRRLERWLDPTDLLLFLVHERRRIEIEPTEIELEYGFRDIALTGKTLGAIFALTPLLPAPIVIHQIPHWESSDRAAFAGSGSIRVWPGLLIVDAAWYLIRNVKIRRQNGADGGAREAT
jgi:hypothetical protein